MPCASPKLGRTSWVHSGVYYANLQQISMEKENISNSEVVEIKNRDEEEEEENILKFLGSLDGYITLMDSLSSDLRKGWLDLASARHSMGTSRISRVLFDLKEKSAAATIQVSESSNGSQPEFHYKLSKWSSSGSEKLLPGHMEDDGTNKSDGAQLRHRGSSILSDDSNAKDGSTAPDSTIIKERAKSLSIFGTLVSPKLRCTQASFESALETVIEIANMRSSLLSAYSQLQKKQLASE